MYYLILDSHYLWYCVKINLALALFLTESLWQSRLLLNDLHLMNNFNMETYEIRKNGEVFSMFDEGDPSRFGAKFNLNM